MVSDNNITMTCEKHVGLGEGRKLIEKKKNMEEADLNLRKNRKEKRKEQKKVKTSEKQLKSLPEFYDKGNMADEACSNSSVNVKGKRKKGEVGGKGELVFMGVNKNEKLADDVQAVSIVVEKGNTFQSMETNEVENKAKLTNALSQNHPVCHIGVEKMDAIKEQERKEEKDCPVSKLQESKDHGEKSTNEKDMSRDSGDKKKKKKKKKKKILEDKSRLKDENQIKMKIKHSSTVNLKEIVKGGVDGKQPTSSLATYKTNTGKEMKSQKGNSLASTPERPPSDNLEEKTVGIVNGQVNGEISSPEEMCADEYEVSNYRKKRKKENKSILAEKKTSTKKKKKRVSFSEEVEMFSPSGYTDNEEVEENLVQGKRFTLEEDDIIRKAIAEYIEAHQLGKEGERMILHCKDYPKIRNCWRTIAVSLPHRPRSSVYYRGHSLLERSEKPKWTPEEYDTLRRFVQKNGRDWRKLGDMLCKYRFHVKDAWRRVGSPNYKKGAWSQDEYQALFDLVNLDLRMKVNEEKISKHGMLKDNIHWEAISKKLSTRYNAACCLKWYRQLSSPLVTKGLWSDVDDYLLIDALQNVDTCCEDDVDWDNLLDHRSGDVCQNRWKEMVRHIDSFKEKAFIEQVEVLSKRYSTEMIEYRK